MEQSMPEDDTPISNNTTERWLTSNGVSAAKRKRSSSSRLSSDNCRTCRRRRLKCDRERPSCRRCLLGGRLCEGYSIWEVRLHPTSAARIFEPLPQAINTGPANRAQLLSRYLERYYPAEQLAAPSAAHAYKMSFLHHLADSAASLPALQAAVETLCLSHLAKLSDYSRLIFALQDSYLRSLSLLRIALGNSRSALELNCRRDIVAASAALSLLPTTSTDLGRTTNEPSVHLAGAMSYLQECGPSVITTGDPLNMPLLFNIHLYSMYSAYARRKRVIWTRSAWRREVPQIMVDPIPEFPAAALYIPGTTVHTRFVLCSIPRREYMVDVIHEMPGLLERADSFVQAKLSGSARRLIEYEFEDLVQRLDDAQTYCIRPLKATDAIPEPTMINATDKDSFNLVIEEHAFIQSHTKIFKEFYSFAKVEDGWNCASNHQFWLIADCTLLQVMSNAYFEKGLIRSSTEIEHFSEVERRAYWHASEICRCTFFYSQRTSLSAARFLHSLIRCAEKFFGAYGAVQEQDWCRCCSAATMIRIERVRIWAPPTLCRLSDMIDDLPSGCHYRPISRFGHIKFPD